MLLDALPRDVIEHACKFLAVPDYINFATSSKSLYETLFTGHLHRLMAFSQNESCAQTYALAPVTAFSAHSWYLIMKKVYYRQIQHEHRVRRSELCKLIDDDWLRCENIVNDISRLMVANRGNYDSSPYYLLQLQTLVSTFRWYKTSHSLSKKRYDVEEFRWNITRQEFVDCLNINLDRPSKRQRLI